MSVSNFGAFAEMKVILRAIYVASRALRSHIVRRIAGWVVGSSQYQTVHFDGLTVRDFADGGLLYLKLMGELDWYREMRHLAEQAAAAPVVLDIGGNVGASALPFSQVPGARVLVFEPFQAVADLLQDNLERNSAHNVKLYRIGMSDCEGVLTYQDGRAAEECRFSTVDLVASDLERVDFVKIDTDGYDLKVFRGALETLRRHHPVIVTEFVSRDLAKHSGQDAQRAYAALIEELGYDAYIKPPIGAWRPVDNATVANGTFNSNLLLLPRVGREAARRAITGRS